jgi:hypothetical protein
MFTIVSYIIILYNNIKNNINNWDKIAERTFEKIKFTIMDMWQLNQRYEQK